MAPRNRTLRRFAASPKTYRPKLEMLEERLALSTFTVVNTNDSGAGSLRQAILNANAATGTDLIDFNIAGSGVQTIRPTTALPNITGPVTIDGYTQAGTSANTLAVGNNAVLLIELDGSLTSPDHHGLTIQSTGSTVRGLVINNFSEPGFPGFSGIRLDVGAGNTIAGNFIGTDSTGTIARGNGVGIYVADSDSNMIGGPNPADRNVISGSLDGIRLGHISSNTSRDNVIQGNYIGTNAAGTAPLANFRGIYSATPDSNTARDNLISGNTNQGLIIERSNNWVIQGNRIGTDATGTQAVPNGQGIHINGSAGTIVGGTTPEERNLISGNSRDGLFFGYGFSANSSAPNVVQGNFIGTDVSGTLDLGNGWNGVLVGDWQSGGAGFGVFQVGGTVEGARNVISGNGVDGIRAGSSGVVTIQGNYIGTDVTGIHRLGNSYRGVALDGLTGGTLKLGGVSAQERNLISANGAYGVHVAETKAVVQGNYIGTDVTGSANLGNGSAGVFHSSYDGGVRSPTIGGLAPEAGNLIAYNGRPGIWSIAQLDPAAFLGNRIHSNAGLGIDLGNSGTSNSPNPDGVTPNDAGDGDGGPNSHQNYPELTTVESTLVGTRVVGSLNSIAGQTYRLEFFANSSADPSGFGEGEVFLGAIDITTDAGATKAFDAIVPGIAIAGHVVAATATRLDAGGNPFETSEFSGNRMVVSPNSLPITADDAYIVNEDGTLTVASLGVLANDTDPDGDALTAALAGGPVNGTVALDANGSFTYTPNVNFNGVDSFTYAVNDGGGGSATGTVTIAISPVNDAPSFTPGPNLVVDEDSGPVVLGATASSGGDWSQFPDGSPCDDGNGGTIGDRVIDGVCIGLLDGSGSGTAAWATSILAGPANESEQAVQFVVTSDATHLFSEQPAISPVGTLSFTPAANAHGMAIVTVQLMDDGGTDRGGINGSSIVTFTITILSVNDPPTVGNEASETNEDTSLRLSVSQLLANDSDVEGDALTMTQASIPGELGAAWLSGEEVIFAPAADFVGTVLLQYTVSDSHGDFTNGFVTVLVRAVNDAPSFVAGPDPVVNEDSGSQVVGGSTTTEGEETDWSGFPDGAACDDGDSATLDDRVNDGVCVPGMHDPNYVPPGWASDILPGPPNESDQLVEFVLTNDAPHLFTEQPSIAPDGLLRFTPAQNGHGIATVSAQLRDNGGIDRGGADVSAIITFTITILPVNDSPSATGDSAVTNEGTPVTLNPLANDSDLDGDALAIAGVTQGSHGTAIINSDGTITYTPSAGFSGEDSFSYDIADGHGGTAIGVVSVTVRAVTDVARAALLPDDCCDNRLALVVHGTSGDDVIVISPAESQGALNVTVNDVLLGTFAPTGRIAVYGHDGNDDIQVAGGILLSAWLYGGSGDDRLKGASGDDLLLGEDGSDLLVGGSGRDLLIGGIGADRIVGNADDDILIAGTTLFDAHVAALCAILGEWTSSRTYEQRTANMNGTGSGESFDNRLNGTFFLRQEGADPTVLHDDACDVMTGSAGIDWFFADLDGDVTDKITDLKAAEFAADLDWIGSV